MCLGGQYGVFPDVIDSVPLHIHTAFFVEAEKVFFAEMYVLIIKRAGWGLEPSPLWRTRPSIGMQPSSAPGVWRRLQKICSRIMSDVGQASNRLGFESNILMVLLECFFFQEASHL